MAALIWSSDMGGSGFDSFVMFAEMRTGSNFLEANLNALPGVTCHGETFNPHFIGRKDQTEMFGMDMAARAADPLALLRRMRQMTDGMAGFRFFHDHDARVLDAVLADAGCAKIILTRNPLECYISLKIAQETGQWKMTNASKLKSARVRFDTAEFERHLAEMQDFQIRLLHGLQSRGQTAFYLDYEDIQDIAVLNGLAQFLGLAARLDAPDATLKKQNPEDITEKVVNPAEMAQALARLDRFNLARTPNFEPRRTAAIPSFVAAAGLLYMPLRGGPEAVVMQWLSALGNGALTGNFVQKSLRQWKRRHNPHRSFTVLRHPVARAHAAFCSQILGGALPELRNLLVKTYKIALPAPGQSQSAGAHRAAFLEFLRFLKRNLAGQTGLRVDAHWATQTAALQGFAQFQGPDVVLREDRLAEGLAWLAAELGLKAPPLFAEAENTPHPLATIYDAEIEAAVHDAYQRDYMGFGFGPWR
ncbi:MAG: sulfotransferase family 2 domain-containing protein [Pseudorhodobacter sp.]|nr:sulfotransferase family 2 domain-containing protein [Pseudorhodobacter sp.]